MKDIPLFTGSHGMATLILREIPYRAEGYVLLRTVFDSQEALMQECDRFCCMAGAERTYFSGNGDFTGYPVYASLIERRILRQNLPKTEALAVPTRDKEAWLRHYRERFRAVPAANSAPRTENCYDIVENSVCIGIGQIEEERLLSVAALQKGRGRDCVCALAAQAKGETLTLLCAEQNLPAMRLYDSLGFSRGNAQEVWYCLK